MKLQTKIMALLLPLIILPMILVGCLAYQKINWVAAGNAQEHIATLLHQTGFNLQLQIQRAKKNLNFISQDSLLKEYINADESQRYGLFYRPLVKRLQTFQEFHPDFLGITILRNNFTEDLQVFNEEMKLPITNEVNKQLHQLLELHPEKESITLANLTNDEHSVALITKPLYSQSNNKPFGHLVLAMDLCFVEKLFIFENDFSPNLVITDKNGTIFYESNPELNDLSAWVSRSNIRTKHFNRLTATKYQGESLLAITYPIASNIYATGFVRKNTMTKIANELNTTVVVITFIMIVTFAIALFVIIKILVTAPLGKLGRLTESIAEGDMTTNIEIKNNDEIGELAKAFTSMRSHLKESTEQIEKLAYFDSLTGLPNKVTFLETIQQLLITAKAHNEVIAVLFFDLDNFKNINDGLGHDTGDLLLRKVSSRLKECIRANDILERAKNLSPETQSHLIARMGGDEFTLVLSKINTTEEAAKVAVRILSKLSQPFVFNEHEIYISASIGIACFPHDGDTSETLLKHADIAMYEAKARGKNNFQYFDHKMNEPVSERLALESSMRSALENNEFRIVFQPKVPLNKTGRYEFEALIRWQHPEKGFISPAHFISIAEETGFIQHIGDWMMDRACAQIKKWQQQGYENIMVSLNLSPVQFNYGSPDSSVRDTLSKYDLHPKHLELEITESGLMKNENTAANILNSLQETGVSVALDDFGTGYSSLAYLLRFPIDTLKIDRAFIRNIADNQQALSVLKTIIELAKSLDLETVAEGVETEEQLNIVQSMGCNIIQGYLFSKPLPADEAIAFFDDYYK